ncbi:hypothetical protein [Tessaracoccus coleopterorum]|uniref:hypothetical protein n=1 Tax=Tessaracoccus coleopterorum TaxID=2714950 RepID=UPI0018D32710|nr:hypothetical protein [Tessaracoccus coleopterorum]
MGFNRTGATKRWLGIGMAALLGAVGFIAPAQSAAADTFDGLELTLSNGPWPTSHVQGIAVDVEKGYIYYSFTTLLVKTDLQGNLVGTVGGFTGHLGDLDINPADGRVYGSLEYKAAEAFYIAIFDVDKITEVGMDAQNSHVVSTVHLQEVVDDYAADMDGDGDFDGNIGNTPITGTAAPASTAPPSARSSARPAASST